MSLRQIVTLLSVWVLSGFAFAQDPSVTSPRDGTSVPADSALENQRRLILLPIVYYTPETSLAAGAIAIKNLWKEANGKTSHILTAVSLTSQGQSIFSLTPRLYLAQGKYELGGVFSYKYFPDQYYGIGEHQVLSSPEKYTENSLVLAANFGVNLYSDLFFRMSYADEKRSLSGLLSGGRVEQDIADYSPVLETHVTSVSLEWDNRDYPQSPTTGEWYKMGVQFYNPYDVVNAHDLSSFQKYDLDLRKYFSLNSDWILAGQIAVSDIQGAPVVPFYYLNTIPLRAYYHGRYRDRTLALIQPELRWGFRQRMEMTFFAGAAKLATELGTLNDADQSRLLASVGAGWRYFIDPENRTCIRLDLGVATNNLGFYFVIGEAF